MTESQTATQIIGNANTFAIQFELINRTRLWGRLRFMVNGRYIGDIDDEFSLYNTACTLRNLLRRNTKTFGVYATRGDVISFDDYTDQYGTINLGEGFDAFSVRIYAIVDVGLVCFDWIKHEWPWRRDLDYPPGMYHEEVGVDSFDDVVNDFLSQIGESYLK